jgi:hypothetical protein
MNLNVFKEIYRCKRCMILWNFSDLFTCEDMGLYHFCDEWCKQLIIIDEYRPIYEMSGQIFDLSSREIETVQIFFHNECLQKISESLTNVIDEIKATFDLKKKNYRSNQLRILKLKYMTIVNSSKKIKAQLTKTIKIQLTRIAHSSKKIKTQLTKTTKIQLTRITHSSKKIKIQLTKTIMTQLTKIPHSIKKMKIILSTKLLLHST